MQEIVETYPNTMLWRTDTPSHYFIGRFLDDRFLDDQHQVITLNLNCGPDIEITEFRKLPGGLQRGIGHDNTIRFLFG